MKYFKYLLFILTLMAGHTAFAQIYSIKLHLTDDKTSEPVAFATASVTVKGETSPLKYVLTDDQGDATIICEVRMSRSPNFFFASMPQ